MARIRSVKPELRTDLTVAAWSREVRYAWVLLWGYLDDYGRGRDDLRLVVADLFPLDRDVSEKKLNGWLHVMATVKADDDAEPPLCRYEVRGQHYLHAVNWTKHQRVSHPKGSALPSCPVHDDLRNDSGNDPDGSPEPFGNDDRTPPEPFPPSRAGDEQGAGSREQGAGAESRNDSAKPKRAKPKTPAPESFVVDDELILWADEHGISPRVRERETERFLDYHRSKGNTFIDWRAAWRNWMGRVDSYGHQSQVTELRPSDHWIAATGGDVA